MSDFKIPPAAADALAAQLGAENARAHRGRVAQGMVYGVAGCLALVFVFCVLSLVL
jgi:hypothetical protein